MQHADSLNTASGLAPKVYGLACAQALSLDHEQLRALLGEPEMRELLEADALREVEDELSRRRFLLRHEDAVTPERANLRMLRSRLSQRIMMSRVLQRSTIPARMHIRS